MLRMVFLDRDLVFPNSVLRRALLPAALMALAGPGVAAAVRPLDLPPLPVRDTAAQLQALGCAIRPLAPTPGQDADPSWRAVVAADADGTTVAYCPPRAVGQVHVQQRGTVAGIVQEAIAQQQNSGLNQFVQQAPNNQLQTTQTGVVSSPSFLRGLLSYLLSAVELVLVAILGAIANAAGWVLLLSLNYLIEPLLFLGSFITNPAVRMAWPIMLGLANMGFLIALLVIALLTVLQAGAGVAVRRWLPRLFLGALLVNFSLVIGGAILDFTRLLMAILMGALLRPEGGTLGQQLFHNFNTTILGPVLLDSFQKVTFQNPSAGVQLPVGSGLLITFLTATILWIGVLATAVLVFSIAVRYVALLLLLAVSPFAYLFLAFPNTGNLARRWWTHFLKYVFYGPAVLLILLMAVAVTQWELFAEATADSSPWMIIFQPLFMGVLFYVAVYAGKTASLVGSAAAMKYFQKRARQVPGRVASTTLSAAGAVTGTGARIREAGYTGRDFWSRIRANLAQRRGYPKRGADKALKKGQESWGTKAAEWMTGRGKTKEQRRAEERQATDAWVKATDLKMGVTTRNPAEIQKALNSSQLSSTSLRQPHILRELQQRDPITASQRGHLGRIVQHSERQAQIQAIFNDKELMKQLNSEQRIQLEVALNDNATGGLTDKNRADLLKTLHDTIERVDREKAGLE